MRAPSQVEPALWAALVAAVESRMRAREPAHDLLHVRRVVANVILLSRAEGVSASDEAVAATAALLHEVFTLPKDHPESSTAGDTCALHATAILEAAGAPKALSDGVAAAIRDHAFSKGVVPSAVASQLLQDADRLDALGAIGLARMWATCADMKRPFYATDDPFCETRAPDDKQWGLDHVKKKLLVVPEKLHTRAARELAKPRVAYLRAFLAQLEAEIA